VWRGGRRRGEGVGGRALTGGRGRPGVGGPQARDTWRERRPAGGDTTAGWTVRCTRRTARRARAACALSRGPAPAPGHLLQLLSPPPAPAGGGAPRWRVLPLHLEALPGQQQRRHEPVVAAACTGAARGRSAAEEAAPRRAPRRPPARAWAHSGRRARSAPRWRRLRAPRGPGPPSRRHAPTIATSVREGPAAELSARAAARPRPARPAADLERMLSGCHAAV
jgi:hypothetical protein